MTTEKGKLLYQYATFSKGHIVRSEWSVVSWEYRCSLFNIGYSRIQLFQNLIIVSMLEIPTNSIRYDFFEQMCLKH